MRYLQTLGAALILVGAVLGVVLALGLYSWETNTRAALALANPSPTPTIPPPAPTPTIALANQPAGIPTSAATDTPAPTVAPSPTAAASPSPSVSPGAASPTAAAAPTATSAPAATPTSATTGDPVAGQKAFAQSCASCHPNGNAGVGPALHGPAFTARFPDDATLKAFIRAGHGIMPPFPPSKLSDTDLNNIVAYLRSLK